MERSDEPGCPWPHEEYISARERFYDRDGKPINAAVFDRLLRDREYRIVARHHVAGHHGEYHVLTVWFGTDQSPHPDEPGPLIFGTAAPSPDGKLFEERQW